MALHAAACQEPVKLLASSTIWFGTASLPLVATCANTAAAVPTAAPLMIDVADKPRKAAPLAAPAAAPTCAHIVRVRRA